MAQVDVSKLQRQLELAWYENDKLKQENLLLRRTIRSCFGYWPTEVPKPKIGELPPDESQPWAERSEHFDRIREQLLDVAVHVIKKEGVAVGYDPIIRAFQAKNQILYRSMANPQDTLSRRLRELRDAGYLVSPTQGTFFLGKRVVVQRET